MKKLFLLLSLFSCSWAKAQEFPEPSSRLVNDYTQTLSAEEQARLEQKLVNYEDSTSTQVAIVVIRSLGGYDVADYAVRLAEKWKIGQAKKNNGVLILAALDDRKVTIQTGYGMEGVLPDAICKRIIENEIKPSFREGDYYGGLSAATDAIIAYSKGEYQADAKGKRKGDKIPTGLIIVLGIVLFVVISALRKKQSYMNYGSRGAGSIPFWMLMNSGSGGRGSFGDFSSGGGSFGGFGGGSFGGGGSSGSW